MEVNYFGTLIVCRAFAPVLKTNGGGVIANVLSSLAVVNIPVREATVDEVEDVYLAKEAQETISQLTSDACGKPLCVYAKH